MFLDGESYTAVDRRGMHPDTGIVAWKRRCSSIHQWCTGTASWTRQFKRPFIRHGDEVAYLRRLSIVRYVLKIRRGVDRREEVRLDATLLF